ncbi:MAG: hypothetical protein ACYC4T_04970 [Melioribacteraceae bacterium]
MKYFLFSIIFLLILFGCNTNNKKDEQEEQNKKRNFLISEIRKEYKVMTEEDVNNFNYTIQFSKAFIDSSNLFIVEPFFGIDDFIIKDGRNYFRFSSLAPTIYFSVDCDTNNFVNLLNIFKEDEDKKILLVIKIDDIKKLFLTADPQNDGESNYIELDYSSSFVANGHLITYRFIN